MTASGDGDRALERVLLDLVPEDGSPCADVDPEALVGLLEGRLSEAERDAVLRRLSKSEEGRRLAGALADLREEGVLEPLTAAVDSAPHGLSAPRFRPYALAALVLLLLGGALWAGGAFDGSSPDPDARLVAAARALERASPELFTGFSPLDARERAAPPPAALRGGIRLLRPAAVTLDVHPRFSWLPVPGATSYRVRVLDDAGRTVVQTETSETAVAWLEGSALRGRTYVAEVETEGPLGKVDGQRTFTVAADETLRSFEAAGQVIEETQPEDLGALLWAHVAIRQGLLEEAEQTLDGHLDRHPEDELARETLRHVLRQLGDPRAASIEAGTSGPR